MNPRLTGLLCGMGVGFLFAWARLSDPRTVRAMLLLREADIFLFMGSAVIVAGIGVRVLKALGAKAFLTGEPIHWAVENPKPKHILGSMVFGAGWSIAGTCPGPAAAMIGQGGMAGLLVAAGIFAGARLRGIQEKKPKTVPIQQQVAVTAGL